MERFIMTYRVKDYLPQMMTLSELVERDLAAGSAVKLDFRSVTAKEFQVEELFKCFGRHLKEPNALKSISIVNYLPQIAKSFIAEVKDVAQRITLINQIEEAMSKSPTAIKIVLNSLIWNQLDNESKAHIQAQRMTDQIVPSIHRILCGEGRKDGWCCDCSFWNAIEEQPIEYTGLQVGKCRYQQQHRLGSTAKCSRASIASSAPKLYSEIQLQEFYEQAVALLGGKL